VSEITRQRDRFTFNWVPSALASKLRFEGRRVVAGGEGGGQGRFARGHDTTFSGNVVEDTDGTGGGNRVGASGNRPIYSPNLLSAWARVSLSHDRTATHAGRARGTSFVQGVRDRSRLGLVVPTTDAVQRFHANVFRGRKRLV